MQRKPHLDVWVDMVASLTKPDRIHWCDGSAEEYDQLAQAPADAGTFQRQSDAKRPNSYLALSDPDDVARVADRTFICSKDEFDAGPTNRHLDDVKITRERIAVALDVLSQLAGVDDGSVASVEPTPNS